ncbi:MAG: hypothetical protein J5861_02885 [Desulfovibrio sp.]|nr:hypothetical protein [Desulfovibrio sp.]
MLKTLFREVQQGTRQKPDVTHLEIFFIHAHIVCVKGQTNHLTGQDGFKMAIQARE